MHRASPSGVAAHGKITAAHETTGCSAAKRYNDGCGYKLCVHITKTARAHDGVTFNYGVTLAVVVLYEANSIVNGDRAQ